jgi:hypothetical protein
VRNKTNNQHQSSFEFPRPNKLILVGLCYAHTQDAPASCKSLLEVHTRCTQVPRATTTLLPTAAAKLQPCRVPRLLVARQHRLYVNLAVRREYSPPGCRGSTSTTPCAATTHLPVARGLHQLRRAQRLLISRSHGFYINYVVRRDYSSPGCTGSTSTLSCVVVPLGFSSVSRTGSRRAPGHCVSRRDYSSSGLHQLYCTYVVHPDAPLDARLLVGRSHWLSPCARSLHLATRLLIVRIAPALLRLCCASGRAVSTLDFSLVDHTGSHRASGHCVSRCDYSSSGLHRLYCAYVVHLDAPSRCSTSRQSVTLALAMCPVILLCIVTTRLADATDILHLRRASGCRGSSRGSSHRSSSTTSPTPRVRVPRLVAWLVVDYFASRRLVIDYFTYDARPGASARCAARRAARRRLLHLTQARRRLLRLRRASGCLGTSRGSSCRSSSTSTTPRIWVPRHVTRLVMRLVVDYFAYTARLGASARRMARRAARRQLLHLRHTSGCHSSSRGSSCRSSSTTSPTPRIRVPRLVALLVAPLVVDYFASCRLVVNYFT